jgi:hypothetical protein
MTGNPPGAAAAGLRARTALTACAGVAASAAVLVLLLAVPGSSAALAGGLLLAAVPAGAAVMSWVDSGDGFAQAGLTLVLSLAVTAIASALMIWLSAWHPRALLALAAVGLVSGAARLAGEARR